MLADRVLPLIFLSSVAFAEPFDPTRLEKEILVPNALDPLSLQVAPDGSVYFLERPGVVKKWDPASRAISKLGEVKALAISDTGALSLLLARDFPDSPYLYLIYGAAGDKAVMRLARFTVRDGTMDPSSERRLLEIPIDDGANPYHCGAGLAWDREGNLLLGTGDNTPPQDTPPVNHPPNRPGMDARRSAANSQDLRGKILRIRLTEEGGYTIPAGNLFRDPTEGRPEIFAMGCRNPFRVDCDPKTGWILWGDVGGNVNESFGLGWEGCDEINLAAEPGFFGWPYFSGPNKPWRSFDPATKKPAGEPFNPANVLNDSPQNTGLRALPRPRPALIWYPAAPSEEWPALGSGGRSVTGGPIYRHSADSRSSVKLPDHFDGCLIFGEWMRNWLMAAKIDDSGQRVERMERFAPHLAVRKPSDIKVGPDGAIYLAEYGDRWNGNADGQITRIVYRRGNRPPVAQARADVLAGKAPLQARFAAAGTRDPDGDAVSYEWRFPNGNTTKGAEAEFSFTEPGQWTVELTASDPHGGSSSAKVVVAVGNAPPTVAFDSPRGGFFQWGKPLRYRVSARDEEDGVLPAEKVLVQVERRDRALETDETTRYPGLAMMRAGTCFACHSAAEKSAGPPYVEVAKRYATDPGARERLAKKVVSGGAGVWAEVPMPPHPQHTEDQARLMVDWILSLNARQAEARPPGLEGEMSFTEPDRVWGQFHNGVVALTASAMDQGANGVPPLRGEAKVILRSRRQLAYFFDRGDRAAPIDYLEEGGAVASLLAGGWLAFESVNLAEVSSIRLRIWPHATSPMTLEAAASPDGPSFASAEVPAREWPPKPRELTLSLAERPRGLISFHLRARGPETGRVDVAWLHFED